MWHGPDPCEDTEFSSVSAPPARSIENALTDPFGFSFAVYTKRTFGCTARNAGFELSPARLGEPAFPVEELNRNV